MDDSAHSGVEPSCPGPVTNWSGWKAAFELPVCDTVLHLPITELDRPFESAIVFQSRPDDRVLIFSRVIDSMSQVNAFSPIFGAALAVFPSWSRAMNTRSEL